MSIKIINDNIINAKEKNIIDCVDYRGNLDYGSANMFYKKYSNIFGDFKQNINKSTNLEFLLGLVVFDKTYDDKKIYGLISECDYINNELKYFDYKAFFKSLSIALFDKYIDSDVAIPYKLGCIRTTANWDNIYEIIETFSKYLDYDIIIYKDKKGSDK